MRTYISNRIDNVSSVANRHDGEMWQLPHQKGFLNKGSSTVGCTILSANTSISTANISTLVRQCVYSLSFFSY